MGLDVYLREREEQLKKIRKEIGLLRRIDFPVTINTHKNGFALYSENYSLVTDFDIKKRSQHISGSSGYDGGLDINRVQTYPQFYFNLKHHGLVVPVYVQHEGFDKDNRIVIKSQIVTRGWGDFKSEAGVEDERVDLEKVFGFFREQGVKENLINRLGDIIKQFEEF